MVRTRLGEMEPGTGGGLYFSTDLVSWTDIGAGLPTKDIACLARDSAGYLYAGTRGFGVYRSVLQYSAEGPAVLDIETPLPVNAGIDLHIYPQPAASSATVSCRMSSAAPLTLALYDVLGRRLGLLSDGRQYAAGLHHFPLDLTHLPAGTYVLRAFAAQGSVTTLMLVHTR